MLRFYDLIKDNDFQLYTGRKPLPPFIYTCKLKKIYQCATAADAMANLANE